MPIVVALLIAAVVTAGAAWWWRRVPVFALAPNPNRNVLLITVDSLRADALGVYGGRAVTPNLDRLAASGARFTFAHAHAVTTLPSHATILTGRYPYEHGIRDDESGRLRLAQPTAAALLKARGFVTGAFIGGGTLDHRTGLAAGFDRYDDRMAPSAGDRSGERERRADAVVRAALDWIGAQGSKWFAWVHVYDPHTPYRPPTEWAARFPSDPYLGEVSWTDAALGRLFDALATGPNPTLVIVTADHGEALGDHGEPTHGIFAYESTLRVPLIVAEIDGPRKQAGMVVDAPVRLVDVLPTLLDASGTPALEGLPGTTIRSLLSGEGPDRPTYFEAMMPAITRGWAPLRGVLMGREKYIDLPVPEIYDLGSDPSEKTNRAPQESGRREALLAALRRFDASARPDDAQSSVKAHTEADDPKRLVGLEQLMQHAADAYSDGRTADAIEMYRSVIEKRGDTADAYRRLALVYWQTGRTDDAIATLETALHGGLTRRPIRNTLGQYLAEAGQPVRAIALLDHDSGDDPDALVALGNAYQLAGRDADALRTFNRLVTVTPDSATGYEQLGLAQLKAGEPVAAETSLRRAIALDGSLVGAHTGLGLVLASTGRRSAAIDEWKRAIELDERDANALFNLTLTLLQDGRRDEARDYGSRFIRVAPPAMKADVETVRKIIAEPQGVR